MENITSIQEENTNMIGGTIREIAGKSLADKNYLHLFDENIKNTIQTYLKTNPNLEPIKLTPQDNLALAERWQHEINYPSEISKGMTINQIAEKEANYHSLYNHATKQTQNIQNMETQTTEKQFDITEHLNNQMKYLGFGDNHKEEIQKGIEANEKSFQIHTTSDRVMEGNKVDFAVNFNKSEKGGVFLNSFDARLITQDGEERSHNFKLNFTVKEAINLLEGRAVKTELSNKQGEKYEAFVKLNFAEEKNEYGNYKLQTFNKNYGVDTSQIVEKSELKFDKPEYRENAIKALEKGNIINAKFKYEGKEIEGKAVLNPQYKTLNLYDKDMNRLNTNKPLQGLEQDNSNEKNNVREQSISRSIS